MIDARRISLCDLAEVRSGYPFRGAIEPAPSGPVAVVQMKDVSAREGMNWAAVVRTELTGRREPDWLVSGDVVFVTRGNHYYAAALTAIHGKSICGPHLYRLRVKASAALLPQFLSWQINQPPIQRLLRQAAEGSSQRSIRRAELEALPISVPPLADQERIIELAQGAARERALLDQLICNREQQLSALAFALKDAADRPKNKS